MISIYVKILEYISLYKDFERFQSIVPTEGKAINLNLELTKKQRKKKYQLFEMSTFTSDSIL